MKIALRKITAAPLLWIVFNGTVVEHKLLHHGNLGWKCEMRLFSKWTVQICERWRNWVDFDTEIDIERSEFLLFFVGKFCRLGKNFGLW